MNRVMERPRFPRWLIVCLLLAAGAMLTGAIWLNQVQTRKARSAAVGQLTSVARQKVEEIERWRDERGGDAAEVAESPLFQDELARWLVTRQAGDAARLLDYFRSVARINHLADVRLVDTRGRVLLSLSSVTAMLPQVDMVSLGQALRANKAIVSDLHKLNGGSEPHIDAMASVRIKWGSAAPVGVVVLSANANGFLFPLIESWPTASRSAETLLVRRDGKDVLFLNNLRFLPDAALKLRIPLTRTDVPAVMAVEGRRGVVEGMDYREVRVLSVLQQVPGSPWLMVVKEDASEVFGGEATRSLLRIGLVGLLILALFGGIALVWQGSQKRRYREAYHAETARQELFSRFQALLEQANDAIIIADADERIVQVNIRAGETYGYSRDEFLGLRFSDLVPSTDEKARKERMRVLTEQGSGVWEVVHVRKDGSRFPVETSIGVVRLDRRDFFQAIIRDISERKEVERRLATSLKLLRESEAGTIQALGAVIDYRDPYTSGHQRGVAAIACAIARDLGLPEDTVEGLRVAALLHDIGKIAVPVEILLFPGPLTQAQMSIVQSHVTIGHDTLKGITFPWPVAQMVLQHHERSDGSGYPAGLAGDEIMLEARILAVADTAEAMTAHRPYRPAHTLEATIAEIEAGAGSVFDEAVAMACVGILRSRVTAAQKGAWTTEAGPHSSGFLGATG